MEIRDYVRKAQEANAIADAAESPDLRRQWEDIAEDLRKLARDAAEQEKNDVTQDAG